LHLVLRNHADDSGIDWLPDAEMNTAIQRLADAEGAHHAGPGLPWPLLPRNPAHLLVALPAFGGPAVPDHVVGTVAHALREVGARRLIDELADDLLRHRACILLQ
jgi:hypothetical protein